MSHTDDTPRPAPPSRTQTPAQTGAQAGPALTRRAFVGLAGAAGLGTGRNVKQLVHRALQIARSEPAGPVYLTAAREVLEEQLPPQPPRGPWWDPVAPAALADPVADEIAAALEEARPPLIVTSYLGRDPAEVAGLTALCELAGIGVLESVPMR